MLISAAWPPVRVNASDWPCRRTPDGSWWLGQWEATDRVIALLVTEYWAPPLTFTPSQRTGVWRTACSSASGNSASTSLRASQRIAAKSFSAIYCIQGKHFAGKCMSA